MRKRGTLAKADEIHLHVRFRGGQTQSLTVPIPKNAWQARQTEPATLALIDRLLDDHTDAEIAERLSEAGHRSGEGRRITGQIVGNLRRGHGLPSRRERLRRAGMLSLVEMARRLDVHTTTVKKWERAGLLIGHKANDKNERLYERPDPGDPRLVKSLGWRLADREHVGSAPGGAV